MHLGSASCHYGPPSTSPIPAEARALCTDSALFIGVRWDDPTADTLPRAWERGSAGWRLDDGDEDGVAILCSRTAGPFGCQETCHMWDFAIRQGELADQRAQALTLNSNAADRPGEDAGIL